jgi:hypothetical protein
MEYAIDPLTKSIIKRSFTKRADGATNEHVELLGNDLLSLELDTSASSNGVRGYSDYNAKAPNSKSFADATPSYSEYYAEKAYGAPDYRWEIV